MLMAWPILEDTLSKAYNKSFSEYPKIANLVPEFQIHLNDLLENDFNTIFKLLLAFYEMIKEEKEEKLGLIASWQGSQRVREQGEHIHRKDRSAIRVLLTQLVEIVVALGITYKITSSLLDFISKGLIQEKDVDSFNCLSTHPKRMKVQLDAVTRMMSLTSIAVSGWSLLSSSSSFSPQFLLSFYSLVLAKYLNRLNLSSLSIGGITAGCTTTAVSTARAASFSAVIEQR
ncbi:unnamed protein product, partial [Thlaspi arvense]